MKSTTKSYQHKIQINNVLSNTLLLIIMITFMCGCQSKNGDTKPTIIKPAVSKPSALKLSTTNNDSTMVTPSPKYAPHKSVDEMVQKLKLSSKQEITKPLKPVTPKKVVKKAKPRIVYPQLKEPSLSEELVQLNFNEIDITEIIHMVSDLTGINFSYDSTISGTINIIGARKITIGKLYGWLESHLEMLDLIAIPSENIVKIVKRDSVSHRNPIVYTGADLSIIPLSDTLRTQIIPLSFANAKEIATILEKKLSSSRNIVHHVRTNQIIITDLSRNIYHAIEIIQELDIPEAKAETTIRSLIYASASELSEQITEIMQNEKRNIIPGKVMSSSITLDPIIKIQADSRTNMLIITANPTNTNTILKFIDELDIPKPSNANNFIIHRLQYADAGNLAKTLSTAIANLSNSEKIEEKPRFIPEEETNSLIIFAKPQDRDMIINMINTLDTYRAMIDIQMEIVEFSDESLLELGIDWQFVEDSVENSVNGIIKTKLGNIADSSKGLTIALNKFTGGANELKMLLNAQKGKSNFKLLSHPNLSTVNHTPAEFIVGEEVAFVGNSRVTETNEENPTVIKTYDYKDVGITLLVTPHINEGNQITLDIDLTVKKIIEGSSANPDTPTTSKRHIKSTLAMANDTTFKIGGLVRDDKLKINHEVPLLADIPLLGNLFKWKKDTTQTTNLVIFITPHVHIENESMTNNLKTNNQKNTQISQTDITNKN